MDKCLSAVSRMVMSDAVRVLACQYQRRRNTPNMEGKVGMCWLEEMRMEYGVQGLTDE